MRQAKDGRNTEAVSRFLNRGLDLLTSPRKYGFDQDPILAAAYEAEQLVGTVNEFHTRAGGNIHGVIGSGNVVTNSFNRIDGSNLPDE
ncbi:hypothetical protein, partial [Streptomyces sp. NPDC091259]|uniref:hypothetical protein n=1 Tax=Streptomyces sp. NPDC091259 TaxID=3365976 RepID=UPI00381C7701